MNAPTNAALVGVARGWREFRQVASSPSDMWFTVFISVVVLVVVVFQRDAAVAGSPLSLAVLTLPGLLGTMVAFGGLTGAAGSLAVEREDGTLLRAKAIPHGVIGYLTGRVVAVSLISLLSVLIILVPGLVLVPDLASAGPGRWAALVGMLILGLLATIPIGAVLGALAPNPTAVLGLVAPLTMVVVAISGIFYPVTALPGWLRVVAQVFPFYWLGLGTRSALLPDAAAAVEVDGSWRTVATVVVLGLWALVGLVAAPTILRRVARRESASVMERRHQRARQRLG